MKLINDFSFSLFLWQIILFLIITAIGYGQNAQSVLISNNQGFDKSVFADIDLKENETHYSLKVKNISLNRYDFTDDKEKQFANADKKYQWTAVSFFLENDKEKIIKYYFPINKKVMENGLNVLKKNDKVILYFTIYKTDNTPIIVINKVSELE